MSQVTHTGGEVGAHAGAGERGRRPPTYATSFIGRRVELAELSELLAVERLVTIVGAGGCGKTRLAREALVTMADRGSDGVRWADLGGLSDPAQVADVVATAAGVLVEPSSGPVRALARQLRDHCLILCLDNCEHLLDACADIAGALLTECPCVTVLVTSREPLGLPGERVWRVPPMAEQEAMALFVERARVVGPGYAVGAFDQEAVRTVCRRLDGIPLAIELAAAWICVLTPSQISVALNDRFRLLVGSSRGVIPRQQTLAASVGWSYDLLHEQARTLFRRLGVFPASFTLEAAEAVCGGEDLARGDVLALLRRLVDASMVNVEERRGLARYRLLETVREYATQRLDEDGESPRVRDRHLDHFLELGEVAADALERDDQDDVLDRLELEYENLRAALDWGLDAPDPDRGRRLAVALTRLWFLHGRAHEGIQQLDRAIARAPDDRSSLQGQLLSGLALLGIAGGRLGLVEEMSQRAIEIGTANDDDHTLARAYAVASYIPFYVDFARSQETARLAQRHGADADEVFATDLGLLLEACSLTNRDRHAEAERLAQALYERTQPRNDRFAAAFARSVQLWAATFTGDLRRAVALGTEAVQIAKPLNDYLIWGTNTINLAWAMGLAGDLEGARGLVTSVVRAIEDAGRDVDVVGMSVIVGKLHLWAGELETAVQWTERAARFSGGGQDNWIVARALPVLARALRHLGRGDEAAEQAEQAADKARRLEVPHAVAEALDESAFLAADHDPGLAADLHHEALQTRVEHNLWTFVPDSLDGLARLAAAEARFPEAVRLLATSANGREQVGYPRPTIDQPAVDVTVDEARTAMGDEGFEEVWAEGSSLSLDEAAAYVSRSRGPRQRPSVGWASLTPTELQVVDLVAEGLTNPEIGRRLFMSRDTVKTHLAHVYAKLGVPNRVKLASLVHSRRGSGG